MGEPVLNQRTSENDQADAFLKAIHAEPEEKARILQQHRELMHIVDYYDMANKTHMANNMGFQEALSSGKYEQMLASDIRAGHLHRYEPHQAPHDIHPATSHKTYDMQSGMLKGFDIDLGPNEKPLHVDLQQYSPHGKTVQETQQLRADISDMYHFAVKRNPEDAALYFKRISQDFPQGISWQETGKGSGADRANEILRLQGSPNLIVITSQKAGEEFIRHHGHISTIEYSSSAEGKQGQTDLHQSLQNAASVINVGDHFSDAQKDQLNALMAQNMTAQKIHIEETHGMVQQADRSTERALGS